MFAVNEGACVSPLPACSMPIAGTIAVRLFIGVKSSSITFSDDCRFLINMVKYLLSLSRTKTKTVRDICPVVFIYSLPSSRVPRVPWYRGLWSILSGWYFYSKLTTLMKIKLLFWRNAVNSDLSWAGNTEALCCRWTGLFCFSNIITERLRLSLISRRKCHVY